MVSVLDSEYGGNASTRRRSNSLRGFFLIYYWLFRVLRLAKNNLSGYYHFNHFSCFRSEEDVVAGAKFLISEQLLDFCKSSEQESNNESDSNETCPRDVTANELKGNPSPIDSNQSRKEFCQASETENQREGGYFSLLPVRFQLFEVYEHWKNGGFWKKVTPDFSNDNPVSV